MSVKGRAHRPPSHGGNQPGEGSSELRSRVDRVKSDIEMFPPIIHPPGLA